MNELIINKEDLIHNINVIKSNEAPDYTIIAVVKGNGYGLGIVEYTKFLISNGIKYFAVASMQEALVLRQNGIKESILLLTPYKDALDDLIDNDITLTVDSKELISDIDKKAKKKNKKVKVHIKVDTGLNRYGFKYDDINNIINCIKNSKNLDIEGIYSHFSTSLKSDSSFSYIQFNRFNNVLKSIEENNIDIKLKHICNSSGYFKYRDMHLNASRIGSAFLGLATGIKVPLKKIGKFHTKVIDVKYVSKGEYIGYANSYKVKKNMKIAVLATGYYEGIGLTIMEPRFKLLSKLKKVVMDIKKIFKDDTLYLDEYKVIGQIGMHDVVIDITGKNIKKNDDIYFYYRPVYIDETVLRKYE